MLQLARKTKIVKNKGKGGGQQILPSRTALNTLTKGDPAQRSMNNYAQQTPGIDNASPDVTQMGDQMGYSSR